MQTKTEEAIDAVKLAMTRLVDARNREVGRSKEGHYLELEGARHWLERCLQAVYKAMGSIDR
jgi:hypothetical protein